MGPFYNYLENDGKTYYHNSWHSDYANFTNSDNPWFCRNGSISYGILAGQFAFSSLSGANGTLFGHRLVLAVQ